MKKILLLSNIIFASLFSTNFIFPGNQASAHGKSNFIDARLDKQFDLQKICQEHSDKALIAYNKAIEDTISNIEELLPLEVFEIVKNYRDYSFKYFNSKVSTCKSLFEICAHKIAYAHLDGLNQEEIPFINTLSSIIFHAKLNASYDPELAKMLIRLHLDKKYKPIKKVRGKNKYEPTNKLNECLSTACYLGDVNAVQLLLSKGAKADFVNIDDSNCTPLAYALIREHNYSKIKNKSHDIQLIVHHYELIAEMLINAGANAGRRLGHNDNFIFLHTSNVKIFSLFENHVERMVRQQKLYAKEDPRPGYVKRLGRDIVINALEIGNAEFIKKLYSNRLYRKCVKKEGQSFINLAIKYYKEYDFKELFEFMVENSEAATKPNLTLKEFGYICLTNALNAFDCVSIKNLAEVGISLKCIYTIDKSTTLIHCIKQANKNTDKNTLVKTIELLIEAGVNPYHKNKYGKIALDYALKKEETETAKRWYQEHEILIEETSIDKKLDDLILHALIMTPLLYMLKTYNDSRVLHFIYKIKNEQGAEIFSYKDSYGKTALDYAQERNLDSSIIDALKVYTTYNFE